VLLLLAVAALGIAGAAAASVGATLSRRSAERQLLAIGAEFEQALRSYAAAGPGPHALEDLLKDPRVPGLRRHLRQVYADPLTGRIEWGLERGPAGAIVGIYSLAPGRPIQQGGFEPKWAHFGEAQAYGQWVFGTRPATPGGPGTR
jgi:type II secretory pathway pseudopilin PulG